MTRHSPALAALALTLMLMSAATACEESQVDSGPEEIRRHRYGMEARLESEPLPDLALPDMAGDTVRLRDRLGRRATLVNFWATWCVPCQKEMPALVETHARYRDRGIQVVAVAVASPDTGRIRDWMRRYGVGFPVLRGMSGQELIEYTGWDAVPTTLVVDGNGTVRRVMFGARTGNELSEALRPLLHR